MPSGADGEDLLASEFWILLAERHHIRRAKSAARSPLLAFSHSYSAVGGTRTPTRCPHANRVGVRVRKIETIGDVQREVLNSVLRQCAITIPPLPISYSSFRILHLASCILHLASCILQWNRGFG